MRRYALTAVSTAGRSLTAESRRPRLARLDFCKWLDLAQSSKRRDAECQSGQALCHTDTHRPLPDTEKPARCRKGTVPLRL
jgi:hypothetical protein